jgi:hypothetical protein
MPLTVSDAEDGSILHVQLGSITEESLRALLREFYDVAI